MTTDAPLTIDPVVGKYDLRDFVDLAYRLNRGDPAWVPPLRMEAEALLNPKKNPWFGHGRAQYYVARRGGRVVGRISAHIDALAIEQPAAQGMGPGTGNWGLLEAEDEEAARALIVQAESWLREQGMVRVLAPLSISIWDEPGLLISGFERPPSVMLGHNSPLYQPWIESSGYNPVKQLVNYDLPIARSLGPLVERIIAAGKKNPAVRIRQVDKSRFDEEAALILGILNDAWSDNWGFVPLTDAEIAFVGKKLKPLVFEDLIRVAEIDGRPVAFCIVLPDLNELLVDLNGSLFPFGWARLLWWLRKPRVKKMRVPLMGVVKELQSSRIASQLAFMMIEEIRVVSVEKYGATEGDLGWVLDDNQGMISIARVIDSKPNRVYQLYDKRL